MKNKLLKILSIGSFATIFGFGIYAYGCAIDWWGPGDNSIFSPQITVKNENYEPFFYDSYNKFYDGYRINQTKLNLQSVKDWTEYLEKYNTDVVTYYLFHKEIKDKIHEISKWKDNKSAFQQIKFQHNLDLNDQKTQNFLSFIFISRGNEVYSNQSYDYWDYDNYKPERSDQDFVKRIEDLYNEIDDSKDTFYKNRIWFQVLRAKFYSNERTSVISFFEETSKNQEKNNLYYRGLSYVAGAYKSLGNYAKSNALFSEIFTYNEALMPSSLFDYKPLNEDSFEKSLQYITEDAVKEAAYALQGYYTNSFATLQHLYEKNPKSKQLDFLLSRWININEQTFNIYSYYGKRDVYPSKTKNEIKSKINPDEVNWLNHVVDKGEVSNLYLWKSAAAYFNTLTGNYNKSHIQLQEAYILTENENEKAQLRILRLLNNLLSTEKMNAKAEAKMIEDVNWLFYDKDNVNPTNNNRRIFYLEQFAKKYISALYLEQKNPVMAELTYSTQNFYLNKDHSKKMEKLLLSQKRTAWQDIFVGKYPYHLNDIYESRGINLFFEDKIDEAIVEFEKINNQNKAELPGNPFNGKIQDCNDCDHHAIQKVKYTKLDFLKKVKEMQENIKKDIDVFNNALLVGNAFYNASYFGNARAFYYSPIINAYGNYVSDDYEKILYGMENAKKYYDIAYKSASNNEQKAKISYMLAKVERNDFYSTSYFIPNSYYVPYLDDVIAFKKWKGFEELKNKYSDTKYYQDVIAECGYFRTYVQSENSN